MQRLIQKLLLLHAKDDPGILEVMQCKTQQITTSKKKLMQIIALNHLRKVAAMISEAGYFSLESDEVTDASNKEQVIVCLRWVDAGFNAHESGSTSSFQIVYYCLTKNSEDPSSLRLVCFRFCGRTGSLTFNSLCVFITRGQNSSNSSSPLIFCKTVIHNLER